MSRNLLPRISGAGMAQGKAGAWTTMSTPEELSNLEFGDYEEQGLRTRIQSIPSPWARLLLFRHALEDESHPARPMVANELLDALEFLWSYQARPGTLIRWQPVQVSELRTIAEQTRSRRAVEFATALSELVPSSRMPNERSFDRVVIALIENRPVIASSPFTGLFTAEDAAGAAVAPFFRFSQNAVLRPLRVRSRFFQEYVAAVLLPQMGENDPPAVGDFPDWPVLRRVLGSWLRKEVASTDQSAPNGEYLQAAARLGLDRFEHAFGGLALYHRRTGAALDQSRWRLRSDRAEQLLPLVIDEQSFDGHFYEGAARVNVHGLANRRRDVLPELGEQYPWTHPATDWLSEKILLLGEPLEKANVRGIEQYQWRGAAGDTRFAVPRLTLPLKRDFFRYFRAEAIDEMLSVQVQPSGEVEVTLRVPVGSAEKPDTIVVKKTYTAQQREEPGPGLAMWPPFRDDRWHHYMVFRQDANRAMAEYVDLLPIDLGGERLACARAARTELVSSITLDTAPTALEFRSALGSGSEEVSYGVVLPRYRPVAAPTRARWHVGIDFGTSNTVIAIREDNVQNPWLFEGRSLILPLTEPAETTHALMDAYFMPDRVAGKPFGTAVVSFKRSDDTPFYQEAIGGRVTVPFGGHVYKDDRNRVVGDLKWSQDEGAFYLSSSFLRHTLAAVLAAAFEKGVDPARVTISWGYPRAFTPTQRTYLQSQWEQVIKSLALTGLSAHAIVESLDESRSVLRYFFNLGQVQISGEDQVILDVGGGTTDIAAYGAGRVQILDSVMLGGRNLTGRTLRPGTRGKQFNPFVYSFFRWADQNHLPAVEKEVTKAYLESGQNHLAFSYLVGTRWFQDGRASQFAASVEFHRFQLLVLYAFGGLMNYLGLSFRALAKERADGQVTLPHTVVLAGNGSRYLDWLTNLRRPHPGSEFFGVLTKLMAAAAGVPDQVDSRIQVSLKPKHEVAVGLVSATSTAELDERGHASASLMGEHILLKGVEYAPTSRIRTDEVIRSADAGVEWLDAEMEIERYNRRLVSAVADLQSYGGVWSRAAEEYESFFGAFNQRDLRQETVGRLEFLAQKEGGFQGSILILAVATVLERMLLQFFPEADL